MSHVFNLKPMTSIDIFYQNNKVNPNFDENFYQERYPETKEFYQPHCRILNIDDKHRLFYHWFLYVDKADQESIEYFYATHTLINNFDTDFYAHNYKDTKDFYQPYCSENNIEDDYRLYYHWFHSENKKNRFRSAKDMEQNLLLFQKDNDVIVSDSICIIAHAYFFDVWEQDIVPEIKKIKIPYDLYVSLPEDDNFAQKKYNILSVFPNAIVVAVPNKGADIGPFFKILKLIFNSNKCYDYVLKLHSKKSVHLSREFSANFRRHFYRNLCRNLDYCVDLMNKNLDIGMIGPPNSMLELTENEDKDNILSFNQLIKDFGIKNKSISFISGTMFVCRFELLTKYFKDSKTYNFENGHKTVGTLAHGFERLFGNIVRNENQRIHLLGEKNIIITPIKELKVCDKEKILFFSPEAPNFDQSSGGNRLFEILKILKELHHVYYFVEQVVNKKYRDELEKLGILLFDGGNHKSSLEKLKETGAIFKHAFFSWWHMGETYMPLVKGLYPEINTIVDSVDVHWLREDRGGIGSEERKQREKNVYESCDTLLMVSEEDKEEVIKECSLKNTKLKILSNIHREQAKEFQNGSDVLFVGGFNHTPNIEAAIRCYNIFNKFVQETGSNSTLFIVGNGPPEEIKALHNGINVIVTGYVEDLKSYYSKARVLLAPLTWGAGIKGKICEAAMNKVPVITSNIGSEGFGFSNFKDCFIANSDEEFVAALRCLFCSSQDWIKEITKNSCSKVLNIASEYNAKVILNSILNPPPHVVISIVTFNKQEVLYKCLLSIKNTDYPNFTVVVTDNAASEETRQIVESFPGFRYVRNTKNEYFIAPNNRVIKEYECSDVLLLNDDTELIGNKWLTTLNEAAYSAGYVGCSGGKALFPNGKLQEAGSLLFNDGYGANIGMMDDPFKQDYNSASYVGYVSGCLMYMRRDAIKEVGILDEDYYPMYYEDADWQYRLHIRGYKTVYEPKCLFVHHMGSISKPETVEVWLDQNRKKFVEKFKEYDIEVFNSWERTSHTPVFSRAKR